MLDREQFRQLIINPVLLNLNLYSEAAAQLLIRTAVQESRLTYIRQLGGGPALGVYQMEPATHDDIWENYLEYRTELADLVEKWARVATPHEMIGNLYYATAMCRVHYLRAPQALPDAEDLHGQARYWKTWYNTPLGAGTVEEFVKNNGG